MEFGEGDLDREYNVGRKTSPKMSLLVADFLEGGVTLRR